MRFIILFLIFLFNFQYLSAVEFLGKFEQGSFILGKTKPNSKVKVDDKKIRVSQDGYFAFGLDRDRKNNVLIIIKEDGKTKKIGGSIIHMSSQLGRVGCEGRNVYNMNKFGVEGLARGMAFELATFNIRVNTVCPTFVETPMVKKFFKNKKFKDKMLKNIPLGRVAKESDVATAVAFLAADSSEMITGTSLLVDGGWTAQ